MRLSVSKRLREDLDDVYSQIRRLRADLDALSVEWESARDTLQRKTASLSQQALRLERAQQGTLPLPPGGKIAPKAAEKLDPFTRKVMEVRGAVHPRTDESAG
ncbi:MAG TPA: hypothetical protein VE173_01410 [Longimicrobiales bacterium]|jgi:uncharacterized coiled-coil DUF342 family protein|nr:hypothetical protein [Longimicrobiales bacterium]